MPIYEYQCENCNEMREFLQKVSDAPITECPSCHQQTMKKKVSAASFHLKGTGWYVTDFKDKGKQKKDPETAAIDSNKADAGAKTDTKAHKSTTTEKSTKAESKPDSKSDS